MTELIYALGDAIYAFFSLFEKLGNLPNWLFILLGFVGLFIWLKMQKKYNQEAESTGHLK